MSTIPCEACDWVWVTVFMSVVGVVVCMYMEFVHRWCGGGYGRVGAILAIGGISMCMFSIVWSWC